ncbi:hypothetical protein FRX31_021267, partial [Thalictrum thalictroides]
VTEDMKLVTHIKDVFCSLQNSSKNIFQFPIHYLIPHKTAHICQRYQRKFHIYLVQIT